MNLNCRRVLVKVQSANNGGKCINESVLEKKCLFISGSSLFQIISISLNSLKVTDWIGDESMILN